MKAYVFLLIFVNCTNKQKKKKKKKHVEKRKQKKKEDESRNLKMNLIRTSFPPLGLLDLSFFSSITRCKRSVSISCSLSDDDVDGAPILLFDNVGSTTFVTGCGIIVEEISELVGWFLICCSAALISSTVTLCVDRRSRLAWAERCFRCASASSSRFGGRFDRLLPLVESSSVFADVTVTLAVADDGRDDVTLTTVDVGVVAAAVVVVVVVVVVVDGVDSVTPEPDRRRTYGPVLFVAVNDPSLAVRSVVPHLN